MELTFTMVCCTCDTKAAAIWDEEHEFTDILYDRFLNFIKTANICSCCDKLTTHKITGVE